MAMGGIPHYLRMVQPGESAVQAIDRLFFERQAPLRIEFDNLYKALFEHASQHEALVRTLGTHARTITRNDLPLTLGIQSGGTATKILDELEQAGFLAAAIPFGKTKKSLEYRLTDEYTLFYLKFVDKSRSMGPGTWQSKHQSQAWKSWSGLAFEAICRKHIAQIKKALGPIAYAEESVWRHVPPKGAKEEGAQIDLLIDRNDHVINLCEIKFSESKFTIDKAYAQLLQRKAEVFKRHTKIRKTIHITFITSFGLVPNVYSKSVVQQVVSMDQLYKPL
jgi:hypothetical protein